jgi:SAM-dependent methyltransferase
MNSFHGTEGGDYTERLQRRGEAPWKRWLNVQAPYRWNLRRHRLGVTLDIGCGIGRNLVSLRAGSIGVDHNATSVQATRERGLDALTVHEWERVRDEYREAFDGLLLAHLIEHLTPPQARELLESYLPALKPGGKALFICPQERGYASDDTHVTWTTGLDLQRLAVACGLVPGQWKSFPLPRAAGRWFTYNEFTLLARKPIVRPPAAERL